MTGNPNATSARIDPISPEVVETLKDVLNIEKEISQELDNQVVQQKVMSGLVKNYQLELEKGLKNIHDWTDKLGKSVEENYKSKKVSEENVRLLNNQAIAAGSLMARLRGGSNALKEFDFIQMGASFKNTIYLSKLWEKHMGKIGVSGTLLLQILKKIVSTALDLDRAITGFRKEWNLFRGEEEAAYKTAIGITKEYQKFGVTLDAAFSSMSALAGTMGGLYNVTTDLVKYTSLLSAQLGIGESTTAGMLRNFAILNRGLVQGQKPAINYARELAKVGGIPFSEIAGDLAGLSDVAMAMLSRVPNSATKAAVAIRKLGGDINSMAQALRGTLEFTQSIQDEMEASVLLGRSLNLQRVRELSYIGDIEGATREMLKVAQQSNFLAGQDVFQREATARALGLSVNELMSMLQTEKQLNDARLHGSDMTKKMAADYDRVRAATEAQSKSLGENTEHLLQQKMNSELMKNISNSFNVIFTKLGAVVLPVVSKVLEFVAENMEILVYSATALYGGWKLFNGGLTKTINLFKGIGGFFRGLAGGLGSLTSKFGSFVKFAGRLIIPLMFAWNIFQEIKKILNDPALMGTKGFLAFNGKLILRAIGAIGRALWTTINDLTFGLLGKLIGGMASVSEAIFGALTDPFKKAWEWLGKTFLGNSPSELGLGIVKGIMSVQDMLFKAILRPFEMVWGFISKLFGENIQAKVSAGSISSSSISSAPTALAGVVKKPDEVVSQSNEDETLTAKMDKNNSLLSELIGLLKAGKIQTNMYMDGQLLSATLARQTEFRGGYGVNKVA